MNKLLKGIHHITTLAGDVNENYKFYTDFLGLRLVKKTVNYDNRDIYHFYFGNENGEPGTLFTSFPYGKDLVQGRHGKGMINTTTFSIDLSGLNFWLDRLLQFKINHKDPQERFPGEVVIYLEDDDGLGLELVFTKKDSRIGHQTKSIPQDYSVKGLYSVEIWLESYERMASLLTNYMDHKLIAESGNRFRFGVDDEPGKYIDLLCSPNALKGLAGRGTVHHIAFETPNRNTQAELVKRIESFGLKHTEVRDRSYFESVYFYEPNGVLFEIATSGPGFTVDEELDSLGKSLMLPKQFETYRAKLEDSLPSIDY